LKLHTNFKITKRSLKTKYNWNLEKEERNLLWFGLPAQLLTPSLLPGT
jgi:hypothetical protein